MKKFIVLFVIFVVMFLCILGNFSVESNSNTHEVRPTNTRVPQVKKKAAYEYNSVLSPYLEHLESNQ